MPGERFVERFPPPDRPWTQEYLDQHRALLSAATVDPDVMERFRTAGCLPEGYGVGFDERVVELPWLLATGIRGRTLDAGSALNHEHVLDRVLAQTTSLHIVTLEPEEVSFPLRGISYVFADLRDLPYRDGYFETVVSISTLEHIGMDNRQYGVDHPRAADPEGEMVSAFGELRRVLSAQGMLLVSVPYGTAEDHGWFRQFARSDIDNLIEAAGTAPSRISVYAYGAAGWQKSDLEHSADARYRDFLHDPSPVADRAAAARAVVCLRFDY